jgi:hypothetical protein
MRLAGRKAKTGGIAFVVLVACTATARAEAPAEAWPPFLTPASAYSGDVVAAVERLWRAPTLMRTVRVSAAHVPFELYLAFVDAPSVTAAAARHLGLARYEVEALDEDWYLATDNDGARGVWRVLVREQKRRIVLSRGQHSGYLLGRIDGSALTILELESKDESVRSTLTARVHIENGAAAALARALVAVFGHLADRKLTEGFRVTADVAAWANAHPEEFCSWLSQLPRIAAREGAPGVVMGCGLASSGVTPPRRSAGPATPPLSERGTAPESPRPLQ